MFAEGSQRPERLHLQLSTFAPSGQSLHDQAIQTRYPRAARLAAKNACNYKVRATFSAGVISIGVHLAQEPRRYTPSSVFFFSRACRLANELPRITKFQIS